MPGISQNGINYPATYDDYVPPGAIARAVYDLIDYIYPVGSYYETTNTNFDPNVQFGGTWELESGGLVHVSAGNYYIDVDHAQLYAVEDKHVGDLNPDSDGGEAEHTLVTSEMPKHEHPAYCNWTGAGSVGGNWKLSMVNTTNGGSGTWFCSSGLEDKALVGGDQPHNNMQPYKIVNRWHRTA